MSDVLVYNSARRQMLAAGLISAAQMAVIDLGASGVEGTYFRSAILDIWDGFLTMPSTYEQEEAGKEAVVYLHYFTSSGDWYITEKDKDVGRDGKHHQAFGLTRWGCGDPELGYIDIAELIVHGAELDLHWDLTAIKDIK